jgi:predicted PurR-regulated permease PerM
MSTILKVIGSGLGLWALLILWPEFLMFLVSLVLAVTLHPAVLWMERRRLPRTLSVVIIAALAIGLLALFAVFVLPPLTAQLGLLARDFPDFRARISHRIPSRYPGLQRVVNELLQLPSPGTALAVVGAYLVYHLFETYFLLPRIYGNKLKISTLSVLLALIVGGRLQGISGAVLVLPLVAAHPIIERHWLGAYLRSRVLTDHQALADAAETGSEVAIDAVLNGEKHASEGHESAGGRK